MGVKLPDPSIIFAGKGMDLLIINRLSRYMAIVLYIIPDSILNGNRWKIYLQGPDPEKHCVMKFAPLEPFHDWGIFLGRRGAQNMYFQIIEMIFISKMINGDKIVSMMDPTAINPSNLPRPFQRFFMW